MKKLDLSARNIVRFARHNGIQMRRMDYHRCVFGVVCKMLALNPIDSHRSQVAQLTGRTITEILNLENGFEGWSDRTVTGANPSNRYYKVGQNVARLAGLPPLTGSQV